MEWERLGVVVVVVVVVSCISSHFPPSCFSYSLDVFTEPDINTRVDWVCAYAKQMGCGGVISPQDIKSVCCAMMESVGG
jgi:hypothetical protein